MLAAGRRRRLTQVFLWLPKVGGVAAKFWWGVRLALKGGVPQDEGITPVPSLVVLRIVIFGVESLYN